MKRTAQFETPRKGLPKEHSLTQRIEQIQAELAGYRRKLTETQSQLRTSSTRYTELFDRAPVGLVTLSRAGRIIELNEKMATLLQFPSHWLVGRPFVVFVAKPDTARFLEMFTKSVFRQTNEQSIELGLDISGRIVPVQLSLRTSVDQDGPVYCMSLVDLTEIRKSEGELQQSLENWHSLVHNAPEIIMLVERKGKIVFVNQSFQGRPIRSLIGTPIYEHVSKTEHTKLRTALAHAFEKDLRSTCEVAADNGNGVQSWFSMSFGPVRQPAKQNGVRKTTTVMIREISDQKRLEQTVRHAGDEMREFAARLEGAREEERKRVAREIHDELGQALTSLKFDLAWLERKTPRDQKETRKRMKEILGQVDQTIESVRRIASDLRPLILDDLGLIAAIEWHVKEFQKRSGITCRFRSNADKLDFAESYVFGPGPAAAAAAAAAAAVFRVIQEALTNVMRHANASQVNIDAKAEEHSLRIMIVDNGKGMRKDRLNSPKSLGVIGMRERIARIGGQLIIESRLGKGTRIEMAIPLKS